jgi:5'-nucleotidase
MESKNMKKTILITNDDNYQSKGLKALIKILKPMANLVIIAPANEKSACSHSVTLTKPLELIKIKKNFYKLDDGTPSDCVYISKKAIFRDKKPDLIISGINEGSNMGEDITYSGTVAGAMEGVLQGIPSIAISQVIDNNNRNNLNFNLAKQVIKLIVTKYLQEDMPLSDRELLNINIPPVGNIKNIAITYAGYRIYGNDTHIYKSPRGKKIYWLGLHPLKWKQRNNNNNLLSDFDAIQQKFISITPIKLDLTIYEKIKHLKEWIKNE